MRKHTRHKSQSAKSSGSRKTHKRHSVTHATSHGSKEDMRWQTPTPVKEGKEFPTETMTSETQPAGEEGGPMASEEASSQEEK